MKTSEKFVYNPYYYYSFKLDLQLCAICCDGCLSVLDMSPTLNAMNSESTCRKTLKAVYIKKLPCNSCSVAADFSKSREIKKTLTITTHINGVRQVKGILGILHVSKIFPVCVLIGQKEDIQMMASINSSWQSI